MLTASTTPDAVGATPALAPDGLQRLLVDQMAAVQRTLLATVAGNLLLGGVVVWALHGDVQVLALAIWATLLALHCAANLWVILATRQRPVTLRNAGPRARAAVRSALVLGLVWAGGILGLWPTADAALPQKFLLVFLVAGVSSGALHSLSAHLPTFTAFFVPTVLAVAVAALLEGGPVFHAVAGIAAVYGLVTWRYARSLNHTILEAMRGRHELAALAARLELEVQRVQLAQRARSRLLAAASHDLRQPVHALSMVLGLMSSAPQPALQAQRLDLAQRSVDSLAAQFDALLELGQLDAGALRAELGQVALRPLVEHIVESMRPQAEARGLALRLRTVDVHAFTDPLLAERMLRNLLTNAIRYTDQGGVLVALRARASGGARLEVVDTGIGIPRQAQSDIFKEFTQAEGAAGRGGLGLGLAIVEGCTQLLGHTLAVRSEPGRGSRFSIDLQGAPPELTASTMRTATPKIPTVEPAPGTTQPLSDPPLLLLARQVVILVEDDATVRAATADALGQWGAHVVAASDVESALAQLVRSPLRPALVIADGRLAAGAGGVDAVRRVREEYNDDDMPALVVSADLEALQAARSVGLLALRKPVSYAALAVAALEALGRD